MLFTQEQRRLLWLSAAEITADRVQRMLEQRGSAQALWEDFSAGVALSANAEANRLAWLRASTQARKSTSFMAQRA